MRRKKKKKKAIRCPLFGKLTIVNLEIRPKLIYRFDAISSKIPADFLAKIN